MWQNRNFAHRHDFRKYEIDHAKDDRTFDQASYGQNGVDGEGEKEIGPNGAKVTEKEAERKVSIEVALSLSALLNGNGRRPLSLPALAQTKS